MLPEGNSEGRIRTHEWRDQNPLPYHLATSDCLPEGNGFSRARTDDLQVKSPLLYQLSYKPRWKQLDSNQRSFDYQSNALPTKLCFRAGREYPPTIIYDVA